MARMIPEVVVNRRSPAERKFYLRLREKLPGDFLVFHSLPYANVTPSAGVMVGEVDFLITHRELGLLGVEVKGGERIEYHPREGRWYSWDRASNRHRIKDPFAQAVEQMKDLTDKVRNARVFGKSGSLPFTYGHAVSFPDARVSCEDFPPGCPRELVIDAGDLPRLKETVVRLFDHWRGGRRARPMNDKQYHDLINRVLMPEYRVARSVGLDLTEEEEVLKRLTDEQCAVLDILGERKRALFEGYAGTGKTFIAMEKARRLAADGRDVLLLCYNRPLADHLARVAGELSGRIEVENFHGLCVEFARAAGLEFEIPDAADNEAYQRFWGEDAPLLMLEALDTLDRRFDAVIVDEAQDFHREWWDIITQLLKQPKAGCLYIFYDPMQNIYMRRSDLPIDDEPFRLTRNCRNTRSIATHVSRVSGVEYDFPSECAPGRKVVTWAYADRSEQAEKLDEIVSGLLAEEVDPSQIVILSPHKKDRSCLVGRDRVGGAPLQQALFDPEPGRVRFSTLHRFKGLEADVVIFCDVDGRPPTCTTQHQYVAMSRAKHMLYVLHKGKEEERGYR